MARHASNVVRHRKGNTSLNACGTGMRGSLTGSSVDAVPSLLIAGADPELLNNACLTPRQVAVNEKRHDIVTILDRFQRFRQKLRELSDHLGPSKEADPAND